MKTLILKVCLAVGFVILFTNSIHAQTIFNDNFEDGDITTNPVWSYNTGTTSAHFLDNNSIPVLADTRSLRTNTGNAIKSIYTKIITAGSLSTTNLTWRFLYRNGSIVNAGSVDKPTAGNSSWRFWLAASGSDPATADGYAIIHKGNQLILNRYKTNSTGINNIVAAYTFPAPTATSYLSTYSIRVTRRAADGVWVMYVDQGTGEAVTPTGGGAGYTDVVNSASQDIYSILEVNDNNAGLAGRFIFDNYSITRTALQINCNYNSSIVTNAYAGNTYALYSFQAIATEDVYLKFIYFGTNQSLSGGVDVPGNAISLIRSVDDDYSTTADNTDITASVLAGGGQAIAETGQLKFYNNNTTGITIANGTSYYYFVVMTINNPITGTIPTPTTLSLSSTTSYGGVTGSFQPSANNAYAINSYSCASPTPITFSNPSAPTVTTTTPVTNIYGSTGTVGGSITSTGGATVTEYGIAYSSTATTPSISDGKFLMGNGATGATTYSAPLQGLSPNTTYYIRAYAINSKGTSYGSVVTFKTLAPPDLSYSPPTQTYTVNTNVGSIAPNNAGGAIPANTYLATSTFKSGLSNYFITFDAAGNLYESDVTSVIKITPAGVATTLASGFYTSATQTGIAVDASGNVYVGTTANIIYKITPAGVVSTFINSATLNLPYGMVFDNAGNLFIASYGGGNILKVAAGTTTLTTYATGFNGPYALEIDANGKIYEADRTGNKIYTVVGGTKTQVTGTYNGPTGMAVAADGSIYFSSIAAANNVFLVPPGSTTPTSILASGSNTPRSSILDNTGNFLYISNSSDVNTGSIIKQSVTGYTYTGTLPTGLSFDYTTGTVTGTPTAATAPTGNTITVTGYNSAGNDVTTLTIIVNPVGPTVSTPAPLCGAQTVTLTASGGLPAGGTYNWYSAATGGTAIATGTSYTPFIGGTTPIYVSYTSGVGVSARTLVTVTVNQRVSSSINSPMISYPFESGSLTDWSVLGNNAVISTAATTIAPTLTADRNGMANSAYLFAGTNSTPSYIYSTVNYSQMPLVFSYSLWFKTTVGGGRLLGFSGQQNGNGASLANATHDRDLYMADDGRLGFSIYTALASHTQSIVTTAKYNDGLWHHVIVTLGNTNGMRLYVDGVWANSTTPYNTYVAPQVGSGYWRIGGDATSGTAAPTNNYFTGAIDDVAIYNYEMSATDALSNDMNLYKFTAGYCANNPLTVTAQTITGATYSWVDNDNSAITSAVNPTTFANATSTFYKLTTTVNGCSNTANVTPNTLTFTWTGAASTDFVGPLVTTNWTNSSTNSLNQNPSFNGTESIIIPGTGITNFPVLGTGTFNLFSLTMLSGSSLNLNGKTLNIGCNILNSNGGQILYAANFASKVTWNGTVSSQSYYGSNTAGTGQSADMEVNNTNAGTVTIRSGVLDIYDLLKITKGNLVVSAPATFTLKSTVAQSASVDIIPSTYSISGDVNVERFIQGTSTGLAGGTAVASRRNYRLVSSPVTTVNNASGFKNVSIGGVLQPGASCFDLNYIYDGTPVNGNATNAYDKKGNPTLYFYNNSYGPSYTTFTNGPFKGVTYINPSSPFNTGIGEISNDLNYTITSSGLYQVPIGNGLMVFYRGNKTANVAAKLTPTGGSVIDDATFTATGALNQGTITVQHWSLANGTTGQLLYTATTTPATVTGRIGFNLVGNPYACTINWDNFNGSATTNNIYGNNLSKTIYVLDPLTRNYSAYISTGTQGSSTVRSSATVPALTGNATNMIVSGQGFYVIATGSNPTLTFTEGAKVNVPNPGSQKILFGLPEPTSDDPSWLRVKLSTDTTNIDDISVQFAETASAKFSPDEDAYDMGGNGAAVSLSSYSEDAVPLAINRVPAISNVKKIKLDVSGTNSGLYKLSVPIKKNIDPRYSIYLMDYKLKDSLDVIANQDYSFSIDKSDTSSFGANRFALVIQKRAAEGYQLLSFAGKLLTDSVRLNWATRLENIYTTFIVQKSIDGGKTFTDIGTVQSSSKGAYNLIDPHPVKGENLYRLKQDDVYDKITYSSVIKIIYGSGTNSSIFTVSPNPTADNIKVTLTNNTNNPMKLKIYNGIGGVVQSKTFTGTVFSTSVANLMKGVYVIEVVDSKTQTLIGIAKFVKL